MTVNTYSMDKRNGIRKGEECNYQVSFRLTKGELLAIEREASALGIPLVEWLRHQINEKPGGSGIRKRKAEKRIKRKKNTVNTQISLFERED